MFRKLHVELGVSYIMEGSVQRYGDKARITVQLIDAINDDHIWTENYDRDIVDVFKTQSEIAMHITSGTQFDPDFLHKRHIFRKVKQKMFRLLNFTRWGDFIGTNALLEGSITSIEYFEKAIEEDPGYGLAYAGLADAYSIYGRSWLDGSPRRI